MNQYLNLNNQNLIKIIFIILVVLFINPYAFSDQKEISNPAEEGKRIINTSKGNFEENDNQNEREKLMFEKFDFTSVQKVSDECMFPFKKDGIVFNFKANSALNLSDGKPTTLIGALFQITDLDFFEKIVNKTDGVYVLLSDFSHNSILRKNRIVIQPGEERTLKFDRVENAKYFCIVAGYWSADPSRCIKIFPIPTKKKYILGIWKKGCEANDLILKLYIDSYSL